MKLVDIINEMDKLGKEKPKLDYLTKAVENDYRRAGWEDLSITYKETAPTKTGKRVVGFFVLLKQGTEPVQFGELSLKDLMELQPEHHERMILVMKTKIREVLLK